MLQGWNVVIKVVRVVEVVKLEGWNVGMLEFYKYRAPQSTPQSVSSQTAAFLRAN